MTAASIGQGAWASVYLLHAAALATLLGAVLGCMPRPLGGTYAARFLLGVACYPVYVGATAMLVMTLMPGAPGWLVLTSPAIVALALAAITSGGLVRAPAMRAWRAGKRARWLQWVGLIATLALVGLVTSKLAINAGSPWVEHDSLVYAHESLELAKERSVRAFARAAPEATVVAGHPHTALYQAYIAHALLFAPDAAPNFKTDLPARIAVQATFLSMLAALASLAALLRVPAAIPIAIAFVLVISDFGYLSSASSRDGLRIGSLLILCFFLIRGLTVTGRIPLAYGAMLALAAGAAAAAHTLNIIAIALAGAAWLFLALVRRADRLLIASVGGYMALGLALPAIHYIVTWVQTGRPFGHGFYYYAYVGTPLWDAWAKSESMTASQALDTLGRVVAVATRGNATLFALGLLAAILLLGRCVRLRALKAPRYAAAGFFASFALVMLIPLTGLLDLGGSALSTMHVVNFRYFLVWYPLAALCVLALMGSASRARWQAPLAAAFLAAILPFSIGTVQRWNVQQADNITRYGIEPVTRAIAGESGVSGVWLDHAGLRYYIDSPTLFAYQPPGSSVLQADTPAAARAALEALGASHVLISEPIKDWWDRTALHRLLASEATLVLKATLHSLYRLGPRPISRIVPPHPNQATPTIAGWDHDFQPSSSTWISTPYAMRLPSRFGSAMTTQDY